MTRALLQQALDALEAAPEEIILCDFRGVLFATNSDRANDTIVGLRAALAEPQGDDARDAALWRACKARKDAALAAGFGRSTLRSDAPEEQKT